MPRAKIDRVAVQQEARRVFWAFGAESSFCNWNASAYYGEIHLADASAFWKVDAETAAFHEIYITGGGGSCQVWKNQNWRCGWSTFKYHEFLARGLYRLGFDDPYVLREFHYLPTAHEQLEWRLSMPREFWPRTWSEV